MKQSHNALTYLRAQYRAIYGRAYIKGLATAMIVTSAFATSMAHAANINIDFGDKQNDPNAQGQNQGQDATAAQNDLSSYATQEGYTASEQAADQAAAIYRASQDAQVRALAANNRAAPAPAADTPVTYAAGDPVAPNYPNGLDDFDGTFLDPLVVTKTGQTGAGAETWATTVTINSGATYNIKDSANGDSYDGYSKLLVGSDDDAQGSNRFNMASDATLNMGGNTALQINGIGNDTLGGNINLNATTAGSQTIISVGMATDEAAQDNSKLTVNGNINVGSGEGTAAIYAPNVDLKGDISVGSGGTLVLDGALTEANPTDLNANHGAGNFIGHGTDVSIADGGRVVVGKGSDTKNTVLDLGDGSSNVTGTGTLDVQGTAILTEGILDNFITDNGSGAGNVTLQSGGRMEMKANAGSTTPVDLAKYQFGTTDGEAQINVLDGDEANTIAGDNLALSTSIRPDGRQEDLNLDLEATNLTLGGGVKADGTAFDSAAESLGYRTAVTQNVTFKADSGGQTFHLQDGVTLDGGAHNGQTGTGSGTSNGDVVLMGGGDVANVDTNLENAYRVAQGNYTHSGTITMSGGTLAVGAYGEANDGPYSGDATLALSGSTTKIVVNNTNASNTILVASNGSGSTATLDLTNGSDDAFKINRGDNLSSLAIGQAGTLDDGGRSEVKLNAEQFNALINTTGASGNGMNVVLAGNGVLQVPNGAGNTAGGTGSTASLNTSQLQKITDNAQANRTDIIYFNQGGRLEGDELQVRNDGTNMDIGQGTVAANKLDVVQNGAQSGDFVINSGNIETSHLSSSDNSVATVQVGNNNVDPAKVTMVADPTGASGSINVAINVNGNGQGQSSLNFKNGTWDVDASQPEHAITIDGANASLNVGEEGAAAGSGAVVTLNGLQVTNNGNVNIASESDLKLKGETDLRNGNLQGSGDLYLTSGSTTYLNESSVDNFVNAGSADAERNGGRVVLEGGNLDITATDAQTPVLLNDYSQGVADTDNVDLVVTAESTISSDALAVNDKLNDGWKDKVTLEADDLILGGKADTDYSSGSLNFKEAIVSNTVRFEPTTNSDPNAPTVTDTDFYLRDHVTINAYERSGDGTATSLGNVHIRDLGNGSQDPTYQVLGGTVTHQVDGTTADNPGTFDVTGAKVQIGGADSGSTAFGKDATLQFANDDNSVTDVTIASGSTITVLGNGEGSKSTLDLTGANAIHTSPDAGASSLIAVGTDTATAIASGNTTAQAAQNAGFSVPSDSFFKVNDTQLNQLFKTDDATGTRASGDTNVKVVLGQTGTMHINQVQPAAPAPGEPPVTVDPIGLDISFLAGTDTTVAGSDAASLEGNKIYFDRGGRLEGDALSLTQKNTTTNANLNIGAGTVSANDLALSNDFTGSPDFVVEQGTLEAGKSVNVMNGGKLQLGTGTGSGTANLNLGTYTPTITTDDTGKTQITVADGYTEAGDINAAIALNGNASINVNAGKWVVNNDITSSGTGNKINVGLQGTHGELPMVTDESGNQSPLTAELEAKSFNVGTGNEFNIRDNGTATFTEAFSSSGGKTVIDGKLVIGDEATGDLLTGDVSGHGELEVQGTALLTTQFLNDFTSGDAATGESGGTITLNAGTADFTQDPNATTLDMKNFKFHESVYGTEPDPDADFNIITARDETDPSTGTVTRVDVDASVIKGKEVLIDQSLVTNNTVGNNPDELNLDIHATEKVTLGGGENFTSANTVLGYHQLVTKDAEFKADSGAAANSAFTLHDGITFVATDSNGEGTTGTSTGNVIVKGGADNDFNSFNVAAGTITHSGDLTLDGGELLIGSTEETRTNIDVEKADATLAMASGSKLTIDNTNAPNSIKVQSNGYGSTSTLDLSQLEGNIELKRGSNLTTVTVGTPTGEGTDLHSPIDAILKLNTSSALLDLDNTNVAADQQGLAVVLTGNGALEMVGTNATLDVANIDGYSTTPQSDKVIFSGGGIIMGQDFTLTNQDKNQNKELDLGGGTIWAEKLHLDNAYRDASAPDEPTNLVLATGKIVVGQELTSTSNVIQIGTGEANDKNDPELGSPAEVHLGYFTTTERGSAEVDSDRASSEQGTVQGNIVIAGDYDLPTSYDDVDMGRVQTNASLHVDHGTWTVIDPNGTPAEGQTTAFGDVTVQDGGYLEIGGRNAAGELYVQEGGNEDIDGDGIPDNVGGSLAVLQGDRLLVDGATMTIHANGGAIFNSYDHINGSKVIIEGETHFNGKDENGNPIHPVDPNAPILISGRNALMSHGEGYNQYFQVDDAKDTVTTSLGDVFLLEKGGTLAFTLDENTDFSLNQIKQLRQQLISKNQGEVVEGGYIDLGKATTSAVTVTTDSSHNNRNVIDYSTQSGSLADIKDMIFSNTSQATLTNVTASDTLNIGTVGSVELSGSDTTFKVQDADLAHASDIPNGMGSTNKYFAFNTTGQSLNAEVTSGGHLGLHNGGYIGNVTLADGIDNGGTITETELLVKAPNGGDTHINSVSGGKNSFMGIYDESIRNQNSNNPATVYIGDANQGTNGTVNVDTLDVNGNLTAYNKVTVNKALLSTEDDADALMYAHSLEVNGTTNFTSALKVQNDATFNASANGDNVKLGDTGTTTILGKADFLGNATFNGPTFLAGTTNITKDATFSGSANILNTTSVSGNATFNGNANINSNLNVGGNLNVNGVVEQAANSSINASGASSKVAFDNSSVSGAVSHLNGTNTFHEASFTGNKHIIGGTLTAETVTVGSASTLQIVGETTPAYAKITNLYGTDSTSIVQVGQDGSTSIDQPSGGTYSGTMGSLEVTNVDLKGGTLFVDPDYKQPTAFTAIDNVENGVNGNIVVGKNAAIGLGGTIEELQQTVKAYQQDGSLQADQYGAILAVNKPIKVQEGQFIAVSSHDDKTTVDQINKWRGDADLILSDKAAIIVNLDTINSSASAANSEVATLAANEQEQPSTQLPAAISFEKSNAKVVSEGGDLILKGNYDATKTTQIFQDAENDGVTMEGKDITVRSNSNRFIATLKAGENTGAVTFTYNKDPNTPSNPVDDFIEDNFNQGQNQNNGSNTGGTGTNGGSNSNGTYNDYVQQIAQEDVKTLRSASYLSTFAGAPHAALRAGQSTSEAFAARMDPGLSSAAAAAQAAAGLGSNETGSVWLSPVYSHTESDGFAANGLNYGTDIDLTGVALGAEIKLNPHVKLGAAVNIGTGSADGTGEASTVSNDFNYYGAGAYIGADIGKVSVLGDVTYTVVDNDVTNNAVADKYDASFNSTNLSAGVTGKVNLELGGFNVAPHVGLRYSRIDVDDYSLHSASNGNVAQMNSSSMNLLSVPVGVTLSRNINLSSWKLKPMVDLTVTGNFGDTDMDSSVKWGNSNPFGVNSEVVDDFTYGVKAGLEATNGNLKVGFGVGYTGSENTDELNVGAELRYDF